MCQRPQGVDILWLGADLSRAMDRDLERLVDLAPQLRLMGPGVWWLCRLVPDRYVLEEGPFAGQTLYQILDAEAVPPQQRRGSGQTRNVVNRSQRVLGIAAKISAKPTPKPTPKPRLTRPAAQKPLTDEIRTPSPAPVTVRARSSRPLTRGCCLARDRQRAGRQRIIRRRCGEP